MMPALVIDSSAITATPAMIATPTGPANASAARVIGVSVFTRSAAGETPTMTATIAGYRSIMKPIDTSIPIGMLRPGRRTSSAIEATFVTPAYETKTTAVAESSPLMPV